MILAQHVALSNTEIGVIRGTQIEVHERISDGFDNRPGRLYAAMELEAAITLIQAAGYDVTNTRAWSGEAEDEDAFIDRLAAEWDMAQDFRHDAISAHWGHD